jgi:hypothetical protein
VTITARTREAITIFDLHGPLFDLRGRRTRVSLRTGIRTAFEGCAAGVTLNMPDVHGIGSLATHAKPERRAWSARHP